MKRQRQLDAKRATSRTTADNLRAELGSDRLVARRISEATVANWNWTGGVDLTTTTENTWMDIGLSRTVVVPKLGHYEYFASTTFEHDGGASNVNATGRTRVVVNGVADAVYSSNRVPQNNPTTNVVSFAYPLTEGETQLIFKVQMYFDAPNNDVTFTVFKTTPPAYLKVTFFAA